MEILRKILDIIPGKIVKKEAESTISQNVDDVSYFAKPLITNAIVVSIFDKRTGITRSFLTNRTWLSKRVASNKKFSGESKE